MQWLWSVLLIALLLWDLEAKCIPSQFRSKLSMTETPINKVTILHTNDIHAHFEEFNVMGSDCRPVDIMNNQCFGGVSRIKTVIDKFRATTKNLLLLDAGDQFQGTLFFNTFGGFLSAKIMNEFKYDLGTIGNHEFDRGVDYLGEFIKNLSFPMVNANIDMSTATPLLDAGVVPFAIFPQYNLGIIGFITNTTGFVTKGAESINFADPVSPVQKYVDELNSRGIHRIICLSHNGYTDDQYLAENTRGISLIVGGHSHSLLLKNTSISGVAGPYPTKVFNLDKKPTWIVQAHRYGDYIGHLDIEWNDSHELVSLTGDPILLDNSIEKDPIVQQQVDEWKSAFESLTKEQIAVALDDFDMRDCKKAECALGDLIADAFLAHEFAADADIGLMNAGGIRSSFSKGNITVADVMTILPFTNSLATFERNGSYILDVLERSVARRDKNTGRPVISIPQWSGLSFVYNPKLPMYHRVVNVTIQDSPLDLNATYKIVTNDFITGGGDGILDVIKDAQMSDDIAQVLISYLKEQKEITPVTHGRMKSWSPK